MTDFKKLLTELFEESLNGSNKVMGPFCAVLEGLGYAVSIDGKKIKASDIVNGKYPEYDNMEEPSHVISLFRNGVHEKEYLIDLPIDWDEY